jgi:hypothetical protein
MKREWCVLSKRFRKRHKPYVLKSTHIDEERRSVANAALRVRFPASFPDEVVNNVLRSPYKIRRIYVLYIQYITVL